ncbi:DNA adenine methylase [Bacillus subtilis]|uniref:DNA adenine methylase n=2 Tax=Bacillati TaxID=1783272 RepID=UPI0034E24985
MLTCDFCGNTDTIDSEAFQIDTVNPGFWCELCQGYSYLEENAERHRFTLILEDKHADTVQFVAPIVSLSKRISPYRYPGGKSRIIDFLYTHLQKNKTQKLISPFTGGGSFELSLLAAGVVDHLHLNDLDFGVYALWWVIKHMPYALIDLVKNIEPDHKTFFYAQSIIKNDYRGTDLVDAAWSSLIVNRLAFSGIAKANPLGGKKGNKKSLLSRWNPEELVKRIEKVHSLSDRMVITQENAVNLIEEAYWEEDSTIFIDPPYVDKGKQLYPCYYTEKDHRELSFLLDTLHFEFPGADIITTYDYNEWIQNLYEFPDIKVIGRTYSI